MQHQGFFHRAGPFAFSDVAHAIGATLTENQDGTRSIEDIRSLQTAGASDLAFFENRKYIEQLGATKAGACISRAPTRFALPLRRPR